MSTEAQDKPTPPADPTVYTLKWPVDLATKEGGVVSRITELSLGRLKGAAATRCLNAMQKGPGDFTRALVCESARIPPSTFDQLDAEDIGYAAEVATAFFGIALPTSSK